MRIKHFLLGEELKMRLLTGVVLYLQRVQIGGTVNYLGLTTTRPWINSQAMLSIVHLILKEVKTIGISLFVCGNKKNRICM